MFWVINIIAIMDLILDRSYFKNVQRDKYSFQKASRFPHLDSQYLPSDKDECSHADELSMLTQARDPGYRLSSNRIAMRTRNGIIGHRLPGW